MFKLIHKILNRIRNIVGFSLLRKIERFAYGNFYNNPLGNAIDCTEEYFLTEAKRIGKKKYNEINQYEEKTGFKIDADWVNNLALTTQIVVKEDELCFAHGRVLYCALRSYLSKFKANRDSQKCTIWETGTARGFSSLCMAKALSDHGANGAIVTFDVLPHDNKQFWNCVVDLTRGSVSRRILLESWRDLIEDYIIFVQGFTQITMPKVRAQRIHFAFLDGPHDYEDLMFEFNQVEPLQEPGDIIVCDDYHEQKFPGIVRAINEISSAGVYKLIHKLSADTKRCYIILEKQ